MFYLEKSIISEIKSEIVLWVIYSAKIWVHNEDSLDGKMEFEFVHVIWTAVVSRHHREKNFLILNPYFTTSLMASCCKILN